MGSVVEMRSVRAILIATVAAVALLGGVASTAYADEDPQAPVPATIPDPQPPIADPQPQIADPQPAVADPGSALAGSAQVDPSDPGLPPD
jgi:hypothetical protein